MHWLLSLGQACMTRPKRCMTHKGQAGVRSTKALQVCMVMCGISGQKPRLSHCSDQRGSRFSKRRVKCWTTVHSRTLHISMVRPPPMMCNSSPIQVSMLRPFPCSSKANLSSPACRSPASRKAAIPTPSPLLSIRWLSRNSFRPSILVTARRVRNC